jgi:Spy/CpxP family protein refolding chaperone
MRTRILALAVMMGLATGLVAQPNGKRDERPARGANHEMQMNKKEGHQNALNLTDAQKESFKKSRLALEKQLQPVRNELGEAEARQRTLTTTDKPDMDAVNKNIDKIGSLKTQMAKMQAKHRIEMRAQLTDEQRLMFDRFDHGRSTGQGAEKMNYHGRF